MKQLMYTFLLFLMAACSRDTDVERAIGTIRRLSNEHPDSAQVLYDAMGKQAAALTEHERMSYALLGIRLNDKRGVEATSDSAVRELVSYFETCRNNEELQEVYYYAGSTYRDLQDTPRSLAFFLKSVDRTAYGMVDSLLLRNGFSQLWQQYFYVQDYRQALWAAEEECCVAERLGILDDLSLMHKAHAYLRLQEDSLAEGVMDTILNHQQRQAPLFRDRALLFDLLHSYSFLQQSSKAAECHTLIESIGGGIRADAELSALAMYYWSQGNSDTCAYYYKQLLQSPDPFLEYDASMKLFELYQATGPKDSAYRYAEAFLERSIGMDLGQRQELAAAVNNQFQYYRNKMQEERLAQDVERHQRNMYLALAFAFSAVVFVCLLHYYRQNQKLRVLASLNESLSDAQRQVQEKEQELQRQRELIHRKVDELTAVSLRYQQAEADLGEKTAQLSKIQEQNKHLFMLQHQATLKRDAREMLRTIKDIASGKHAAEDFDWEEFMTIIDTIYPGFNKELYDRLGKVKPKQVQVCYLLKGGFTNAQIENLVADVSRSTIWRWIKMYGEALADVINQ